MKRQIQDHPDDNILERDSYPWSIEYFELSIARQFSGFRRKAGDNSRALIWSTNPSKMFPLLKDCSIAMTKPILVDNDIGNEIPVRRRRFDEPEVNINGLPIDFPYQGICQKKVYSQFHSKYMKCKGGNSLKALTGRFLLFLMKVNPEWQFGATSEYLMQFKICEGLYLHYFFFTRETFQYYMKNTRNYFIDIMGPEGNVLHEFREKAKEKKISDAVRLNMDLWETTVNNPLSPDYSSMFKYDDSVDPTGTLHQLERATSQIVENATLLASTKYTAGGLLTAEYFMKAYGLFEIYRDDYFTEG